MAKAGRKSKYQTHVEPYLAEIKEWTKTMTDQQIAKKLGIGQRTFCDYKRQYPQLSLCLKEGKQDLVVQLKSKLIEKAMGFEYTEIEVTKEYGQITKVVEKTKRAAPDVAALNLLLKNYDKENWANDPQTLELRKKELELRERQVEANEW